MMVDRMRSRTEFYITGPSHVALQPGLEGWLRTQIAARFEFRAACYQPVPGLSRWQANSAHTERHTCAGICESILFVFSKLQTTDSINAKPNKSVSFVSKSYWLRTGVRV